MKQIKKLILASLLLVSTLGAKELLFDLRAQDFSNAQKQKMAKYKISDKIIIETNTVKSPNGGYYYTAKSYISGYFNIEIIKPLNNWKYNLDIVYYTNTKDKKRSIIFTDKFGENIILEFYQTGFTINGKEYKANTYKEHMLINITKNTNNLSVSINAQNIYKSSIDFDNLKSISTNILYDYNSYDELNNLLLVSND